MKRYFPIFVSVLVVAATFAYFVSEVRSRTHTLADFENDRRIAQELGIRCERFRSQTLVGKSKAEMDLLAGLPNSILKKGGAGEIQAAEEGGGAIRTQAYSVCGLNLVMVLQDDRIADAIYVAGEKSAFGVKL